MQCTLDFFQCLKLTKKGKTKINQSKTFSLVVYGILGKKWLDENVIEENQLEYLNRIICKKYNSWSRISNSTWNFPET